MNMLKMCILSCGQARPNSHPGLLCGNTNQVRWSYALKKAKVCPSNCFLLLDTNQLPGPVLQFDGNISTVGLEHPSYLWEFAYNDI